LNGKSKASTPWLFEEVRSILQDEELRATLASLLREPAYVPPGREMPRGIAKLLEDGIVVQTNDYHVLCCPNCQGDRLSVRLRCPACGSPEIIKRAVVTHVACGATFETDSMAAIRCPACGGEGKVGANFVVVGVMFECRRCENRIDMPLMSFVCPGCGAEFTLEESLYMPWRRFEVREEARKTMAFLLEALDAFAKAVADADMKRFPGSGLDAFAEFPWGVVGAMCVGDLEGDDVAKLAFTRKNSGLMGMVVFAAGKVPPGAVRVLEEENVHVVLGSPARSVGEIRWWIRSLAVRIAKGRSQQA